MEYPWYRVVSSDNALTQGDILERCPVVGTRGGCPAFEKGTDDQTVADALGGVVSVEFLRVVVMTQACDLAQDPVRHVILCPTYTVKEYRESWEAAVKDSGQNPTTKAWKSQVKKIVDGGIWNLAALNRHGVGAELGACHLVVDFHEVFSLPYEFLCSWVSHGGKRLQLLPPYREHLSQAFARFFMRVGLPMGIPIAEMADASS